jgi:hypothetical protein
MTKLLGLAGGAFAYLGATASVALARTPAQGGSGDQGNVREEVTGGVQGASEAGMFPFTGRLDLLLLVMACTLLLAAGLTVRRVAKA